MLPFPSLLRANDNIHMKYDSRLLCSASAGFLGSGVSARQGAPSNTTPLRQYRRREMLAAALPGDGVVEEVFVKVNLFVCTYFCARIVHEHAYSFVPT